MFHAIKIYLDLLFTYLLLALLFSAFCISGIWNHFYSNFGNSFDEVLLLAISLIIFHSYLKYTFARHTSIGWYCLSTVQKRSELLKYRLCLISSPFLLECQIYTLDHVCHPIFQLLFTFLKNKKIYNKIH